MGQDYARIYPFLNSKITFVKFYLKTISNQFAPSMLELAYYAPKKLINKRNLIHNFLGNKKLFSFTKTNYAATKEKFITICWKNIFLGQKKYLLLYKFFFYLLLYKFFFYLIFYIKCKTNVFFRKHQKFLKKTKSFFKLCLKFKKNVKHITLKSFVKTKKKLKYIRTYQKSYQTIKKYHILHLCKWKKIRQKNKVKKKYIKNLIKAFIKFNKVNTKSKKISLKKTNVKQ